MTVGLDLATFCVPTRSRSGRWLQFLLRKLSRLSMGRELLSYLNVVPSRNNVSSARVFSVPPNFFAKSLFHALVTPARCWQLLMWGLFKVKVPDRYRWPLQCLIPHHARPVSMLCSSATVLLTPNMGVRLKLMCGCFQLQIEHIWTISQSAFLTCRTKCCSWRIRMAFKKRSKIRTDCKFPSAVWTPWHYWGLSQSWLW